ncbi:anti-sigma factor family protein, partial [Nocardia wallacei]|uniref:anti-sigma factor family protein n=1 Tax=Nocardia wallacei TaxID=480035 RepID=UPI002458AF13
MTETAHAAEPEGDDYATWDGPYVLGALGRDDRLEYEEHLAVCPSCRAAVAELAGLPGLLGQVDSGVALSFIDPIAGPPERSGAAVPEIPEPPPVALARLADRTRRQRRRGRMVAVAGAVVAAAAAVGRTLPVAGARDAPAPPPPPPAVVGARSFVAGVAWA